MSRAGQILRRILVAALLGATLGGAHGALVASHGLAARPAAGLGIAPTAGPPGTLVNLSAPPGSLPAGAVAVVNFQDATAAYPGVPIGQGAVGADGSINFPVNVLGVAAAGLARIFVTANGVTISNTFT